MFTVKESPYFFEQDGKLSQAVSLVNNNEIDFRKLSVSASGLACEKIIPLTKNVALVPIPGALPQQKKDWELLICYSGTRQNSIASLGNIRPFSIFIAQDKHLDYGWKHKEHELDFRMNDIIDFYLGEYQNRGRKYNFDCLLWLEQYLSSHTEAESNLLMQAIAENGMSVGAFTVIPMTGIMSGEELAAAMRKAKSFANTHQIPIEVAIPNECMTWGLASCLSNSGIPYLARGAYDLANPHIKKRDRIPLFYWEGPDGTKVLTHYNILEDIMGLGGYGEASKLRLGSFQSRIDFIEHAIDTYESFESYTPNSFLLLGTGWDDYPRNSEVAEFIEKFNAIGFSYPKLIDASYLDFFKDLEEQIAKGVTLPTLKGDYGCGWEIWGSQLAYASSLFRQARRLTLSAEAVSAISCLLTENSSTTDLSEINFAFENLFHFSDHNFGGILPDEYDDMRDKKIMYAQNAHRFASRVVERSLGRLKAFAKHTGDDIVVFNPVGWKRSGSATVLVDTAGQWLVWDQKTGEDLPTVTETKGVQEEHYVTFYIPELAPFETKTFRLKHISEYRAQLKYEPTSSIENNFFRLEFDESGLTSLYSKSIGSELLDKKSKYQFNNLLYWNAICGEITSNNFKIQSLRKTSLETTLITTSSCGNIQIETSWTLSDYDDTLKVTNRIFRPVEETVSSLKFVFPFALPNADCRYNAAYSNIDPRPTAQGGNLLNGASRDVFCALSYADLANTDWGISTYFQDSFLFQWYPETPGTLFSLIQSNFTRNDFIVDQGGQRRFSYTYVFKPYRGLRHLNYWIDLSCFTTML